jgi:hypothetical protein
LDVDRARLITTGDVRIDLLFTMSDNMFLRDHYIGAKKRIHMHGRVFGDQSSGARLRDSFGVGPFAIAGSPSRSAEGRLAEP